MSTVPEDYLWQQQNSTIVTQKRGNTAAGEVRLNENGGVVSPLFFSLLCLAPEPRADQLHLEPLNRGRQQAG